MSKPILQNSESNKSQGSESNKLQDSENNKPQSSEESTGQSREKTDLKDVDSFDVKEEKENSPEKRIQSLGRKIVGGFFVVIRSLKLYDIQNNIFLKPLDALVQAINLVVTQEKKLVLYGASSTIYLNDRLLRLDRNSLENANYLLQVLEQKGYGGFSTEQSITVGQLQEFFAPFRQSEEETTIAPSSIIKPYALKRVKAKILGQENKEIAHAKTQKADRRRYATLLYGRLLQHIRRLYDPKQKQPPAKRQATRIIQELIDLSQGQAVQFLGFSNETNDQEYHAYHIANTTLYTLIFGDYLGFNRSQILELGHAAISHDIGKTEISSDVLRYDYAAKLEDLKQIKQQSFHTMQKLLQGQFDWTKLKHALIQFDLEQSPESKHFVGPAPSLLQESEISLFGRILALCSCFDALCTRRKNRAKMHPNEALRYMQGKMRKKFDPYLLLGFIALFSPMISKSFKSKNRFPDHFFEAAENQPIEIITYSSETEGIEQAPDPSFPNAPQTQEQTPLQSVPHKEKQGSGQFEFTELEEEIPSPTRETFDFLEPFDDVSNQVKSYSTPSNPSTSKHSEQHSPSSFYPTPFTSEITQEVPSIYGVPLPTAEASLQNTEGNFNSGEFDWSLASQPEVLSSQNPEWSDTKYTSASQLPPITPSQDGLLKAPKRLSQKVRNYLQKELTELQQLQQLENRTEKQEKRLSFVRRFIAHKLMNK